MYGYPVQLPRKQRELTLLLFLLLSMIWQGCNLVDSNETNPVTLRGQLSKLDRFYFINTDHYRYDTTSLGGYNLLIDSLVVTTDSLGYFEVNQLSRGRHHLRISASDIQPWDTTLFLDKSTRLSLFVHPVDSGYYQFKGQLHYLPNHASPNPNTVNSSRKNAGNVPVYFGNNWLRTNPDGTFHYGKIKQGYYWFGVYSNHYKFEDTTIHLNQNIKYNPLMRTWGNAQPLDGVY